MANTLDILRTRLRAAGTVGIPDALGYQIISIVQRLVNARFARVVSSYSFAVPANVTIHDIRSSITNATNIISIEQSHRTLHRLNSWRELAEYDRDWYTATGSRPECWAQIGYDLLVIYPARTTQYNVTIYYAKLTTEIDESADSFELPTEDEDLIYDICEILFHAHMRNYPEAGNKMKLVASIPELQRSLSAGLPGTEPYPTKEALDDERRDTQSMF